jgi:alpha-D-ribose 1-methylphosphonate 5-triphosphate synthase subunit PhnG
MPTSTGSDPQIAARQRWMGVLARAEDGALEAAWAGLAERPEYRVLRPPETGLVMVRGRMGGTGNPFNMGEMSATRCAVQLEGGTVGIAWVAGRSARHAELAAAFDALLQQPERSDGLEETVIAPLESAEHARREEDRANAASSRVEFFTMARGED